MGLREEGEGGGRTSGCSPLIIGTRRMYRNSDMVSAPRASAANAVVLPVVKLRRVARARD